MRSANTLAQKQAACATSRAQVKNNAFIQGFNAGQNPDRAPHHNPYDKYEQNIQRRAWLRGFELARSRGLRLQIPPR